MVVRHSWNQILWILRCSIFVRVFLQNIYKIWKVLNGNMRKLWRTFKILLVLSAISMFLRKEEFVWEMNFGTKPRMKFRNTNTKERLDHVIHPAFQYKIGAFDRDYKNPCYKSLDSDLLLCLPYGFIAGMPKCGTSDVYFMLSSHPDVENTWKEPHWWTRERFLQGNRTMKDPLPLNSYIEAYYSGASQNIANNKEHIIVDGSASTLWDMDYWSSFVNYSDTPGAEPHIITAHYVKQLLPQAKFVVLLRNPVERLYSDYLHFAKEQTSPQDFHDKVLLAVHFLTDCIQKYGTRSCVYNKYLNNVKIHVRLRIGLYHVFLKDWLEVFPIDQFLIIRLEDYTRERVPYLKKICTFLNISYSISQSLLNEGSARANSRKQQDQHKGDMWPETRNVLLKFYQPFNLKLAEMLQDANYTWTS